MSGSTTHPTLYIWPKVAQALSLDPACLAAYLHLQLHYRGLYTLAYCASPDESPSGQLPCLEYGQRSVSGLASIIKFIEHLDGASAPNTSITGQEKAQSVARIAQIEAELGDLVAYSLFVVNANWYGHTRPALATHLPVPQRYYVPGRLRKSQQPRLEAAGLWLPHDGDKEDEKFSALEKLARKKDAREKKEKLKRAFEREKVLSKARTLLDPYSALLGSKKFFFGNDDRPSTLDLVFAAHIYLLSQPLADTSILDLLKESYPALLSHAETVFTLAYPSPDAFPPIASPDATRSFLSILPRWPVPAAAAPRPQRAEDADEQATFTRWRWALYGTAFFVTASYIYAIGIVPIFFKALADAELRESARAAEEGEEDEEEEADEVEEVEEVESEI